MAEWLVDGIADAPIPPDDRGLLYADGLFETIALFGCSAPLWGLHMQRLARGCRALGLEMPDPGLLLEEALTLVQDLPRCVIRLSLTRGSGGSGYFPPATPVNRRILIRRSFPASLERDRQRGVEMRVGGVGLDAAEEMAGEMAPEMSGLKHLSRLAQVMIARECARQGAIEALVLDRAGQMVEGLHGNLVIVRNGVLIAPGPHPAAVAGVGLEWLHRRAGERLQRRPFMLAELRATDSIWVINSIRGPCRIRTLDGRELAQDGEYPQWLEKWREEVEECSVTY